MYLFLLASLAVVAVAGGEESFRLEGLSCGGCAASVRGALEAIPSVEAARVVLGPPQEAAVQWSAEGASSPAEDRREAVRSAVEGAGYRLWDHFPGGGGGSSSASSSSSSSGYAFLLSLFATAAAGVAGLEAVAPAGSVRAAVRRLCGAFMCCVAVPKLAAPASFAESFARYDLAAAAVPGFAESFPAMEMALGLAMLLSERRVPALLAAAVALEVFVSVAVVMLRGETVECACAGAGSGLEVGWVTLLENAATMAAVYAC